MQPGAGDEETSQLCSETSETSGGCTPPDAHQHMPPPLTPLPLMNATGSPARRETSTMPQWAGSCWYYLRFIDPNNSTALIDKELER
jgi:hypothetical protein